MENQKFTEEQKLAFLYMVEGKNTFITGPGGCGKSFVVKTFARVYKNYKVIAVTSTTGVSAMHINGTTLHHYLGIGLGNGSVQAMVTKICKKNWLYKRWNALEVLIIDEVSMLNKELFEKLHKIAGIIRGDFDKPFGGIQLIFSGDFLQLPCIEGDFCFESEKWDKCIEKTVYMKKIIRQIDPIFQKCLNQIRVGEPDEETIYIIESRIGKKLENEYSIKPTRLYPLNRLVEQINIEEVEKLIKKNGTVYEYNLEFEVYNKKDRDRVINRYKKYVRAPENLQLTEGCQVMLTFNMDPDYGLVNGSRGSVVGFIEDLPAVRFLNGQRRILDYHITEIEENDKKLARYEQLPLILAYALTIHKGQGASLDYLEVDLENIFEYGQGYVALSRARNLEGLSIKALDWSKMKAHPKALEYYKKIEQ